MSKLSDYSLEAITGEDDALAGLTGKVVLIVNVASRCGYTPQYTGLERLYKEIEGEDFAVLGIPCNQFGGQEPGSEAEIAEFCSTRFDVSFPMTCKIDVKGARQHPLYAWLTSAEGGHPGEIQWNFEKFLIGRDGHIRARYPSGTTAEDAGLLQDIADALES